MFPVGDNVLILHLSTRAGLVSSFHVTFTWSGISASLSKLLIPCLFLALGFSSDFTTPVGKWFSLSDDGEDDEASVDTPPSAAATEDDEDEDEVWEDDDDDDPEDDDEATEGEEAKAGVTVPPDEASSLR